MKTRTATLPRTPAGKRWAASARKPAPVFARDDAAGAAKEPAASPRILVVEDDFLVAADIEAVLLDAGFAIAGVAETAEEAVVLARAEKPALILMDIRLAGDRDGIEAAIEIYRDHGIRSLFASAHSDGIARARAAPARPLGWLQKPYTMDRLVEAVKAALTEKPKAP